MLKNYLTLSQFARKVGLTRQRVHILLREGRIPYERAGRFCLIPKGATIKSIQRHADAKRQHRVGKTRSGLH